MRPQPNACGVYIDGAERLVLPRDKKGWRGVPLAEIEMIQLDDYWIWATSFHLMAGDCSGSATPLSDHHARRAPSRDAAIATAKEALWSRLVDRAEANADARAILRWLDALQPDQADLFERRAA